MQNKKPRPRSNKIRFQHLQTSRPIERVIIDQTEFIFSERELTHVRYMSSPVRLSVCLSVVCNVRAPYSDDWNFRQCF